MKNHLGESKRRPEKAESSRDEQDHIMFDYKKAEEAIWKEGVDEASFDMQTEMKKPTKA